MCNLIRDFMEMNGRRKTPDPVDFPEGEIILRGPKLNVLPLIKMIYIPLPPNIFGVITASNGERKVIEYGGMYDLEGGKYYMEYIDKRTRSHLLDDITCATADGFQVTLKVRATYRVKNPEKVLSADKPVQDLYSTLQEAIKDYIVHHTHDQVIQTQETARAMEERALKQQVMHTVRQDPDCSGFALSRLTIQEWQGDPKNLELRRKNQILEKESANKQKQLQLEQNEAIEEKELERRKGEIRQTQAEAELKIQEIMAKVQQLKIELERLRSLPERRHKEIMEVIKAIKEMPGFPRNTTDSKMLQDLIDTLREKTEKPGQAAPGGGNGRHSNPDQEKKVSDLAQTILRLVKPR